MKPSSTAFIVNSTVRDFPDLPYFKIKNAVLGSHYQLSLVFIGTKRARTLNQTTRGKNYVPNVLSFPLSITQGEIFITPATAAAEAKAFGLSPAGYVGYLFIHGCLHLQGYQHGEDMEYLESQYLSRFKLK